MPGTTTSTRTGILAIDAVNSGTIWSALSLTYSFPTSASFYTGAMGAAYGSGEPLSNFKAFTPVQQAAVTSALAMYSSVSNLTFTQITESSTKTATLRYAESDKPGTAWSYYPSSSPEGGDAWFNNSSHYFDNPVPGSYAWVAMIHETGHALGLKHPHDTAGSFGAIPANLDSLEYSVMSYRSYTGAPTSGGYTNGAYDYPQTLMMYDIAALQHMYGANFNYNGGNTVYKWDPNTGQEFVNGVGQSTPGANRIFMTVWDGGGNDTYDFSNYTTNLSVNLQPSGWTTASSAQLAYLGNGHYAIGNIANALLYNDNPASLIENAVAGSGNDTVTGNIADNRLTGGAGNDIIDGVSGSDTAVYSGSSTNYQVTQNADGSWKVVDLRSGSPDGTDTLRNIEYLQFNDKTVAVGTVAPLVLTTVIESAGLTSLLAVGTKFFLDSSTGSDPSLKYGGADVVAGQFGGWTPIGAEQTVSGYQVAWKVPGANQYSVWNLDINGNFISTSAVMSGSSSALKSFETSFHQDFNGDGVIGVPLTETVIEATGSTSLVSVSNHFFLDNISTGSGPSLKYGGTDVVAGQFSGWTPIGAEQTANGYQVAWRGPGADQYSVWNVDINGNFISTSAVLSGSSSALQSFETSFHQDLNNDGAIGSGTVIESAASTNLVAVGTKFFLDSSTGSDPSLKYGGTDVVAGQFSGWTPIGAEQTANGYQVAWKGPGADQYSVWNVDINGNFISTSAALSGSSSALQLFETSFHQDLNGDGAIGVSGAVIESAGSTSLVGVGTKFFLDNISPGSDPSLKYGGTDVVAGQFSGWTPIGAEQTANGYQVAWKNPGADQYSVWNVDINGNFISTSAALSGSSSALQLFETSFHQDLNGDGAIGAAAMLSTTFDASNNHLSAIDVDHDIFHILTERPSLANLLSHLQALGIFGQSGVGHIAENQMPAFDNHFIALQINHYQTPATTQLEQHLHHLVPT